MSRSFGRPAAGTTNVVELTPPGRAAVSVVLVAGPDAMRTVDQCFRAVSGRPVGDAPVGRIALGQWGDGGEELIACRRADNEIEIHCHGGFAAASAVITQLCNHGCQQISWQEWLRQSQPDPIRAEAQIALAEAPTARTAAILLDQYHGALSAIIQNAREAIASGDWPSAAGAIENLQAFRQFGMHLTAPWRVVLAGPTNVGKSSLINALAGFQRAIVSPHPGTTRDVVTTSTAIDGWPVELADTAGLRDSADELESAGIALATDQMATADLVLVVRDATEAFTDHAGTTDPIVTRLSALRRQPHILNVLNKIDLVPLARRPDAVRTSALTGEGIAELIAAIGRTLVPSPPAAGAGVPFATEQFAAIDAARLAIDQRNAPAAITALQPLLPR